MESIGSKINIEKYQTKAKKGTPENATSERGEFIGKFTDRLNLTRYGYNKLSYPRVARTLQHIPTGDLHFFFKQCEEARNFSENFWARLKTKKT